MSINRISRIMKYCEILEVNKMEIPSIIDKINIMYSIILPPYLNIVVVSNLYWLPLTFTYYYHSPFIQWSSIEEGVYIRKVDIVAKKPTHLHLPSTIYLSWESHYILNLHTIKSKVIATFKWFTFVKTPPPIIQFKTPFSLECFQFHQITCSRDPLGKEKVAIWSALHHPTPNQLHKYKKIQVVSHWKP